MKLFVTSDISGLVLLQGCSNKIYIHCDVLITMYFSHTNAQPIYQAMVNNFCMHFSDHLYTFDTLLVLNSMYIVKKFFTL